MESAAGSATAHGAMVYAVEEYGNSVTAYPESANGNVAPTLTISGGQTQIYEPPGLAVDRTGKIAIADSNNAIGEYTPGASGNVAPVATITCGGPPNFPGNPGEIAFDSHGSLYVIYSLYHGAPSQAIEVYRSDQQSGCIQSKHILFGSKTGIPATGGITIARGMIYTANDNSVRIFHVADNGNVAPTSLIQGANTGLEYADGIAVDSQGYMYVANSSNVLVFGPGASGNAKPARVIAGSNTRFPLNNAGATGIAVDRKGTIFVAVQNESVNSILVFAPRANGNVSPIQDISGSKTGLSPVSELALSD